MAAENQMTLHIDAPRANRLLLAINLLDQRGPGLDPALADLREDLRILLTGKSSGDTDSYSPLGTSGGSS